MYLLKDCIELKGGYKMKRNIFFLSILFVVLILGFASASTITLRPNAQGYYSAWTNSGCNSGSYEWQCVDEDPANTGDNLYTSSKSVAESFGFTDTGLTNEVINSVTLYYYGQRYSSSRYQFQPLIRASSTDYLGSVKTLTASYALYSQTYTTNPATSSAWTIAEVNALEAGMKSYSANYGGTIAQIYAVVDYTVVDTCSDTDGGFRFDIFGTASGLLNLVPYSYSDYCSDATTLVEYYCGGNHQYSYSTSCLNNMTTVCTNGACM